jgi:hypothetical protein
MKATTLCGRGGAAARQDPTVGPRSNTTGSVRLLGRDGVAARLRLEPWPGVMFRRRLKCSAYMPRPRMGPEPIDR